MLGKQPYNTKSLTALRSQEGTGLCFYVPNMHKGAWLSEENTSGGENQSAEKGQCTGEHRGDISSFLSHPGKHMPAQAPGTPQDTRAGPPQAAAAIALPS